MAKPDYNALQSAALMTIEKTCGKFADRDLLPDGSSFMVDAELIGSVNGHAFSLPINSTLTVGHETVKATSSNLASVNFVAFLLGKLNTATRSKSIADAILEYEATQDLKVEPHLLELAEATLAAFRQSKQVKSRGAVKVNTASRESGFNFEAA